MWYYIVFALFITISCTVIELRPGQSIHLYINDGMYHQLTLDSKEGVSLSFLNIFGEEDLKVIGPYYRWNGVIRQDNDEFYGEVSLLNQYYFTNVTVSYDLELSTTMLPNTWYWNLLSRPLLILLIIVCTLLCILCCSIYCVIRTCQESHVSQHTPSYEMTTV